MPEPPEPLRATLTPIPPPPPPVLVPPSPPHPSVVGLAPALNGGDVDKDPHGAPGCPQGEPPSPQVALL